MAKRVLLAEDEPNIVESVRFLLRRAGLEVSVHEDGQSALTAALADPPDAVILDVMLPRIDGFDVLAGLRADAATCDVPVIVLTAKGQREDRERALAGGAAAFMTKPFSNAELVACVARLLTPPELAAKDAS